MGGGRLKKNRTGGCYRFGKGVTFALGEVSTPLHAIVTTVTYNLCMLFEMFAFFGLIIAGLSPCAANTTVLLVKTQLLDQVKVRS